MRLPARFASPTDSVAEAEIRRVGVGRGDEIGAGSGEFENEDGCEKHENPESGFVLDETGKKALHYFSPDCHAVLRYV